MSLYRKLKKLAEDDIAAKLKLDALHATLNHFHYAGREREVCAEAILGVEQMPGMVPADENMKRLLNLFNFYRGEANV